MIAPRWLVAGATLVVASPVLGLLRAGDIDVETALLRVVVCAVVTWAALTLVWTYLLPRPVRATARADVRLPAAPTATPDGSAAPVVGG